MLLLRKLTIIFILNSCGSATKESPEQSAALASLDKLSGMFERTPYGVVATFKEIDKTVILLGAHLKPEAAVAEANLLDDVVTFLEAKELNVHDYLIMGDLNLSCDYASADELKSLDLRKDDSYKWLIDDEADTNVAESKCAYDRFIAKGPGLSDAQGSVGTEDIAYSDHMPISAIFDTAKVSSFNMKQFGETKSQVAASVAEFSRVICGNDIILLLESIGESMEPLDTLVAGAKADCAVDYKMSTSPSTGSTSYKERLLYLYDPEKVSIGNTYFVPDPEGPATEDGNIDSATESSVVPPAAEPESVSTSCGASPYVTPGGYCYGTKDGIKKRVAASCCPKALW